MKYRLVVSMPELAHKMHCMHLSVSAQLVLMHHSQAVLIRIFDRGLSQEKTLPNGPSLINPLVTDSL